MSLTVRALYWFLIVSAATSLVFEARRRRSATQLAEFHHSDDPGDPSSSLFTHRGSRIGIDHQALGLVRVPWSGDRKSRISAIILNWSRFRNVVLIVSRFCDPSLQDVIAEIIVWNNSPGEITAEVSSGAECFTSTTCYAYPTLLN